MRHIICWSGGKDSTATVILFHEHEEALLKDGDEVVINFVEVMFDLKNNVSGHNPDIVSFIYKTKETFEKWGYKVNILRAETDFLTLFHRELHGCPNPERNGLLRGFPLQQRKCWVKRDLKLKPLNKYRKSLKSQNVIEYVGIASDELDRYDDLHTTSLLIKYGLTESDAKELCAKYGMLSPQYELNEGKQKRDGCWFCPYAKLCEHEAIKKANPKAWKKYVSLEDTPNLGYPKWNVYTKDTLHDRDEYLKNGFRQMTIFDFLPKTT